jgi:hypothetical protein
VSTSARLSIESAVSGNYYMLLQRQIDHVSRHPRGTVGTVTPIFSHGVFLFFSHGSVPTLRFRHRFFSFFSRPFPSVFLTRGSFLVFLVCFFRFFFFSWLAGFSFFCLLLIFVLLFFSCFSCFLSFFLFFFFILFLFSFYSFIFYFLLYFFLFSFYILSFLIFFSVLIFFYLR